MLRHLVYTPLCDSRFLVYRNGVIYVLIFAVCSRYIQMLFRVSWPAVCGRWCMCHILDRGGTCNCIQEVSKQCDTCSWSGEWVVLLVYTSMRSMWCVYGMFTTHRRRTSTNLASIDPANPAGREAVISFAFTRDGE